MPSTAASIFPTFPRARVYQITRDGQVRVVAETTGPNGVALSPNQQQLYIADYRTAMVKVHAIQPDGRLDAGKDFAAITVDGLKTDESGNVWMASHRRHPCLHRRRRTARRH